MMTVTGRDDPVDPREPFGALSEFYKLMERNWPIRSEAFDAAGPTFVNSFVFDGPSKVNV